MTKLALIRIKGQVGLTHDQQKTLTYLQLPRKFSVRILEDTPSVKGRIKRIEPFITWGEVDDETNTLLTKKHPQQKTYHLNPPKGGLGRKGIKRSFGNKGAYGYRGKQVNALLTAMV